MCVLEILFVSTSLIKIRYFKKVYYILQTIERKRIIKISGYIDK
jgi:hypothetical protein